METKTNRVIGEEHENPFTGEAVEQVPDFVRDAEAVKDESKQGRDYQEITLKFGKGCIGNTFTGKDGNDYTSILIPNQQPNDHRPWQTFVVRANSVHEDKFGKGMWTKLPAEGHTTVRRVVRTGEDENGRGIYTNKDTVVTNQELKAMVEFYKNRTREQEAEQTNEINQLSDQNEKISQPEKTEQQKDNSLPEQNEADKTADKKTGREKSSIRQKMNEKKAEVQKAVAEKTPAKAKAAEPAIG